MVLRIIKPEIYYTGVIDWDRRLFDEIIPLPEGTSYNSYLIKASKKNALIDTADPNKKEEFLDNLKKVDIKIDYIISNHAEQDHSGLIGEVLDIYEDAKVITSPKCKELLKELFLIEDDKFITVEDGETLSLGDKTLKFIYTPWVHWPETMVTYLEEEKILFSCDFFGSHIATSQLFVKNEEHVYNAAKRYYAEIMMPFRLFIRKNMEKINELDIDIVAPSHGPLYPKPELIFEAYNAWISDNTKNEVIIPYISMHGSTKKMVDYLVSILIENGITVKPFNLTVSDIGELAMSLVDASTLVIATPTILTGPHPSVVYATYLVNALRPKLKFISIIGSYGWGGRTVEILKGILTNLKPEIIDPVIIKGFPKENDFKSIDNLADEIFKKHKEIGLID
ncbi:MAG: FprA family A-type flavoprotein [Methanobacterium sp.]|uniref:FprA family A-type flavoprotein n=1 Tax=Methanobacterium sp. TaxID=2164 RepID=UPI003D6556A1|nr:FprA family A-type flavoprotein [Methanobacterium sp.]